MVSAVDTAKRFLVSLIRTLAAVYGLHVSVTRDAPDAEVRKAYRTMSRKAHPDRGGNVEDMKRLNAAYKEWCDIVFEAAQKKKEGKKKSKSESSGSVVLPTKPVADKSFFFRSQAVLLTYQSFVADLGECLSQWTRFLTFLRGSVRTWFVTRWTATLETNANGMHHAHVMLQFTSQRERNVKNFCFEGLRPHSAANDLLGECFSKKKWQSSVDRGHFYCWANKRGTVRDNSGNLCVQGFKSSRRVAVAIAIQNHIPVLRASIPKIKPCSHVQTRAFSRRGRRKKNCMLNVFLDC